jgi:hypothetical protein
MIDFFVEHIILLFVKTDKPNENCLFTLSLYTHKKGINCQKVSLIETSLHYKMQGSRVSKIKLRNGQILGKYVFTCLLANFITASPTHARSKTFHYRGFPSYPHPSHETFIHHDHAWKQFFDQPHIMCGDQHQTSKTDDVQFPWERTDKAEALKSAAGL